MASSGVPSVSQDDNPSNKFVDDLTGFVDLIFNGKSITLTSKGNATFPQYLQSFEMQRMVNGLGFFVITLVDPMWTEVETLVLNSAQAGNTVSMRYGMLGLPGGQNVSPLMKVKLFQYELDPYLDYCIITIKGLCLGIDVLGSSLAGSNAQIKTVLDNGLDARGSTNIGAYVTELAKTLGFEEANRKIDLTDTLVSKDDFGSTDDVAKIRATDNATILSFLTGKLATKANSVDKDKSPYVFFISSEPGEGTTTTKETFHFHRVSSNIKDKPRVTFTLFSDKSSHIKSFKPSYDSTVVNIGKGNTVLAYGYDSVTGESFCTAGGSPVSPNPVELDPSKVDYTARIQNYTPGTKEYVDSLSKLVTTNLAVSPLTAELTIVGDVLFNLIDCIDIFVNIPAGPLKGSPHNTSGRYIIFGIFDTIKDGVFETTLQLGSGFNYTPAGKANVAKEATRAEAEAKVAKAVAGWGFNAVAK